MVAGTRIRTLSLIAVVALLPSIVFAFTLKLPFFCDDFSLLSKLSAGSYGSKGKQCNLFDLVDPETTRAYPHLFPWWTSGDAKLKFLRPASSLSLTLDYHLWGNNPLGYHLTNILIHCLCCVVLFLIGRLLFEKNSDALVGTLIFTSNPAITFVVAWISDRVSLLALLCSLLGLYAHIRSRREGRFLWEWVAWLGFVLAFLSRESGSTALISYLLYDLLVWKKRYPERWPGIAGVGPFYAACCIPLGFFFVYYVISGYGIVGYQSVLDKNLPFLGLPIHLFKNVVFYLTSLLFLVPVSHLADVCRAGSVVLFVVVPAALLAAVVALMCSPRITRTMRERQLYLFLISWMATNMLPVLAVFGESRYVYAAAGPFGLCMGRYLHDLRRSAQLKRYSRSLYCSLVAFFVVLPLTGIVLKRSSFQKVFHFQTSLIQETATHLGTFKPPVNAFFVNMPSAFIGLQEGFDFYLGKGTVHAFFLTIAKDPPKLSYLGERSLLIRSESGPFLESHLERLFMTEPLAQVGLSRSNGFFTATIEDVEDRHIYAIRFDFATPLSDESMRFFCLKGGHVVPIVFHQEFREHQVPTPCP